MTIHALLADVGGTNARFAIARDGEIGSEARLAVADYSGPVEALRDFFERAQPVRVPSRAAVAVAGPAEGNAIRLTNGAWTLRAEELRAVFGFERVELVNDFAALAWAVPSLSAKDVVKIGGGQAAPRAPAAVIGPGTGLGVAAFVPGDGRALVLTTEGGHVTMAPADERESAILDHLRRRFGHISAERVLSGDGLINLYEAVAGLNGMPVIARSASEVTDGALVHGCPSCIAALETFCSMLGTVAGNLALTLGARGGVYLAGGILPRFAEYVAASAFRERFEAKGRFRDYLAAIPTCVIVHSDPAFLGLSSLLERTGERS